MRDALVKLRGTDSHRLLLSPASNHPSRSKLYLTKSNTKLYHKIYSIPLPDHRPKCGYLDNKEQLEGGVEDGWAFFVLPAVSEGGVVGFCADFPKDKVSGRVVGPCFRPSVVVVRPICKRTRSCRR